MIVYHSELKDAKHRIDRVQLGLVEMRDGDTYCVKARGKSGDGVGIQTTRKLGF